MQKSTGFQEDSSCLSKRDLPTIPEPPHMATLHLGHMPACRSFLWCGLVVGMWEAAKGFPLLPTHRAPWFLEKGE